MTDVRMPGGSGLDLLDVVSRAGRGTPVIVITAYGTVESAVQAMQRGAFDYVLKPFDAGEMEVRIDRALEVHRMRMENVYLRESALGDRGVRRADRGLDGDPQGLRARAAGGAEQGLGAHHR